MYHTCTAVVRGQFLMHYLSLILIQCRFLDVCVCYSNNSQLSLDMYCTLRLQVHVHLYPVYSVD